MENLYYLSDSGSSLDDESGKQILVPFLLCIRLGSEAILRGCLAGRPENQAANSADVVDAAVGAPGGCDHHPPGAPHLTARSPPPPSSSNVFLLTSK